MDKKEIKAGAYTLVMDHDRDLILGILVDTILGNAGIEFSMLLEAEGLTEVMRSFLTEVAEKHHNLGWCQDPECQWVKEEK